MFDETPPEVIGAVTAVLIAVLRVIYDGKERRPMRILLEAILCGALSFTASAGIEAVGLDPDWAIFAGGMIGYLGADTARSVALKYLKDKTK